MRQNAKPSGLERTDKFFNELRLSAHAAIGRSGKLSSRDWLNQFRKTIGMGGHVIMVPALIRRMRLTAANDVKGTVTVAHFGIQGSIWGQQDG
jgi:hypothetical protein